MMGEVCRQLMRYISSIGLVMVFGCLCVKGDHEGLQPLAGEGRTHILLVSLNLLLSSFTVHFTRLSTI